MIPAWLNNAVVEGVQRLYSLSLQGSPAAEILAATTKVWVETIASANIAWDQDKDAIRLRTAFNTLALTADRWPTPRALLQALPPRPEPLALPAPRRPMPPGVKAKLKALVDKMRVGS